MRGGQKMIRIITFRPRMDTKILIDDLLDVISRNLAEGKSVMVTIDAGIIAHSVVD